MDTDDLNTPMTDEQIATATAEAQAAFDEAFTSTGSDMPDDESRVADAPAPAPAAKTAAAPAPAEVDPFAGMPEPVRNLLGKIPSLEQDLKTNTGRLAALQRENDALKAARAPAAPAPAPAPAPASEALHIEGEDAVRRELPEVVDYVRAALNAAGVGNKPAAAPAAPAAPAPAPAADDESDPDELEALDTFDAEWGAKVHSTDFKLFLAAQEATKPGYGAKVMSTQKSGVLIGALSKFNAHQATAAASASAAAAAAAAAQARMGQRNARTAAAVQPSGSQAAAPAPDNTDESAFLDGFNEG